MAKRLLFFLCLVTIVSCVQTVDSNELDTERPLEDSVHFDSSGKNEFIHYADTAAEMNNSTLDSSIIEMENSLIKLKEDFANDPTNSFLEEQIIEMEKSLEFSKSIYQDIKDRDTEMERVIQNR